jgi:hypothetical protein
MHRIHNQANSLADLPTLLHDLKVMLQYHTESGFSMEEANSYAQQLDDIQSVLLPLWHQRLDDQPYHVEVRCTPRLGGFLEIKVSLEHSAPLELFAQSYGHFDAEMCDGSCYQYVYQQVLCYKSGLEAGWPLQRH